MKVVAAYLLALLGGNTCPSANDLKNILGSEACSGHSILASFAGDLGFLPIRFLRKVGNTGAQRRRQNAVSERRETVFRTKRLCREGVSSDMDVPVDSDMMIEEEKSVLEAQTSSLLKN